jgi:hypothetical protein
MMDDVVPDEADDEASLHSAQDEEDEHHPLQSPVQSDQSAVVGFVSHLASINEGNYAGASVGGYESGQPPEFPEDAGDEEDIDEAEMWATLTFRMVSRYRRSIFGNKKKKKNI